MSNDELVLRVRAIREGMSEAVNDIKALEAEVDKSAGASDRAAAGADRHSQAQQRLSSIMGTSRAQTGFLVREIAQMSGVSGDAMTAINALTSGIGPLGIAVTGLALAFSDAQRRGAEYKKAQDEVSTAAIMAGTSVDALTEKLLRQGDATGQNIFNDEVMANGYRKIAEAQIAAMPAQYVGMLKSANQALVEQVGATVAAAKSTGDYANAVLKGAEALAPLLYNGKKFSDLSGELKGNLITAAQNMGAFSAAVNASHGPLVMASGDLDNLAASLAAAEDKGKSFADAWSARIGALKTIIPNPRGDAEGGPLATEAGAAGTSATGLYVSGAEGRNAIDDENRRKRDAEIERANAKALSEAQKLADMQQTIASASTAMTSVQINNLALIAQQAIPVEQRMAMISAYISSLSNAKDINLAITFGGNTDLIKALGLGGSGGQAGSRDFMKEMDMVFSSQSGAIQKKFVEMSGGNKDAAIAAWAKEHAAELIQQVMRDPKLFVNAPTVPGQLPGALPPAQLPVGGVLPFGGALPAAGPQPGAAGAAGAFAGAGTDFTQQIGAQIEKMVPSKNLANAVNADKDNLRKVGKQAGGVVIEGLNDAIDNSMGDIINTFTRSLANFGDGRWVKQAKIYGVTQ